MRAQEWCNPTCPVCFYLFYSPFAMSIYQHWTICPRCGWRGLVRHFREQE